MNTQVDRGALTSFNNFLFHLFAHFGHHFFNACGVDTTVGHQLMQCQASNFAAHGIEAGKHDSFGGVVNDDFHTGGSLEGTDIATFSTNDAALNVVVVDMEHGHGIFDSGFGGYTLNGFHNDALSLLIGGHFGIVHDVVDVGSGSCFGFIFERFHEFFLCFFSR